jgi:hypothetical protein
LSPAIVVVAVERGDEAFGAEAFGDEPFGSELVMSTGTPATEPVAGRPPDLPSPECGPRAIAVGATALLSCDCCPAFGSDGALGSAPEVGNESVPGSGAGGGKFAEFVGGIGSAST